VQRFGDALNLNVHLHSLVLDGVYAAGPDAALRFHPLPPPDDVEVARVVARIAVRIARLLVRRGLGPASDPRDADPLAEEQPLLAQLYGASVAGRIATGPRAGQRVLRVGDRIDPKALPALEGERCASARGVSLHANVAVPARDRRRLERLCRYVARPPVATERLSRLPGGRLLYRLKHRWRDGTTHVVFEPGELLEKLAALVPPPRFHLVRYHGILGPCARERGHVVARRSESPRREVAAALDAREAARAASLDRHAPRPIRAPREERPIAEALAFRGEANPSIGAFGNAGPEPRGGDQAPRMRLRRLAWADLLRRVFAVDVLECPRCGGRMRLLATIHPPDATRAVLECRALPSRAPPITTARTEASALELDANGFDLRA